MAKEPSTKRLTLFALLWIGVMGGGLGFTSCYGHNCDGTSTIYGRNPGEGELLTPDLWESSPATGDAIVYSRERVIYFEVPSWYGRPAPPIVIPYISAELNPTTANTNETIGSGNLAEISGLGYGTFAVKNDTCADYYIRVVAYAAPTGSAVPTPAEADPEDAGADGGAEASASPDVVDASASSP